MKTKETKMVETEKKHKQKVKGINKENKLANERGEKK